MTEQGMHDGDSTSAQHGLEQAHTAAVEALTLLPAAPASAVLAQEKPLRLEVTGEGGVEDNGTGGDRVAPKHSSRLGQRSFEETAMDTRFYFQILSLPNQLYVWAGCNAARMGHLYAAAPTRFDAMPSVTTLLGGGGDAAGASIARRLAMKTRKGIVFACNIPANSPMLEAFVERRILQELVAGGILPDIRGRESSHVAASLAVH